MFEEEVQEETVCTIAEAQAHKRALHTKQDRLLSRREGNTHTVGEVIRTKAVIMIVKHNPIKY